ncbi:hypothetical protein AVEN_191667-1, partial [Araneus ventricosus]
SFKTGSFGGNRRELDSPNVGGHFTHHPSLCYNLSLRRTEIGCVCKDNMTPYGAYLLSDPHFPSKERKTPQTGLRRC